MSKLKMGLSAVITIFVFSLLSVSALAASLNKPSITNVKLVIVDDGAGNKTDGVQITWKAVTGATSYDVYWDGATTPSNTLVPEYVFTSNDFEPSKKYKFAVKATDGTDESELLTIDSIFGLNHNIYSEDITEININSNLTGFGTADDSGGSASSVIKSIGMLDNNGNKITHKTHGDYQNNTNSCATCHQTHTASSRPLLFKNGTYNTCTACHDGTLGFYDVFGGEHAGAGTFGGTLEGNMSAHMANGSVALKAAPGGNKNATSGSWTSDFTCASCHSPHGSFSDRLLSLNPAGMAKLPEAEGGNQRENVGAYDGGSNVAALPTDANVPAGKNPTALLKYVTLTGTEKDTVGSPFYQDSNAIAGAQALMFYVKNGNNWVKAGMMATGNTFTPSLTGATYNQKQGYVIFTNATFDPTTFTGTKVPKPYIVEFNFGPVEEDTNTGVMKRDTTGAKSGLNEFCLACHTDYYGGKGVASKWDSNKKLFAHSVNETSRSCVTCHFAHGTDVTIMKDSQDRTVADLVAVGGLFEGDRVKAEAYMLDNNPSSALKKYTNMSSCWKCHQNRTEFGEDVAGPKNK